MNKLIRDSDYELAKKGSCNPALDEIVIKLGDLEKLEEKIGMPLEKAIEGLIALKKYVNINLAKYPRRNEVHICRDGYSSIGFTVSEEEYWCIREISNLHLEF